MGVLLKTFLYYGIIILTMCFALFTVLSTMGVGRTDRSILGFRGFIVLSDSMSATDFSAGDLVITKECDPKTLKEGDIISYISTYEDSFGEVVTHKIRSINGDGIITYGTSTNTNDVLPVSYNQVVGVYMFSLPKLGYFFAFLKTIPGYIVCIFVPILTIIILQLLNIYRMYKEEKTKEKMKVVDDNRKLIDEIEELKRRLNSRGGGL